MKPGAPPPPPPRSLIAPSPFEWGWLLEPANHRPTLRELFAGMAMQGLLANNDHNYIARESVLLADALIAELKKTEKSAEPKVDGQP